MEPSNKKGAPRFIGILFILGGIASVTSVLTNSAPFRTVMYVKFAAGVALLFIGIWTVLRKKDKLPW